MNTMGPGDGTLGGLLASRRRRRFVGRASEIELFRSALDSAEPPFRVLYLYGPGGIGKSSLLAVLADLAGEGGARVVRLDGRELAARAESAAPLPTGPPSADRARRHVILLDSYEHAASVDTWVRTELLPTLPADALVVIAGRAAPGPGWRSDPAWQELVRVVSLRNLSPAEARRYLRLSAVPQALHAPLAAASHGHPLGLSLLADVVRRGARPAPDALTMLPPEQVRALVRQFLDVMPGPLHRRALEVCALARVTTEELLRGVLDLEEAHEVFDWLRELSFMEVGTHGLHPHDLARDALDADLRWRDPEGYTATFRRVSAHCRRRIATACGQERQIAIFDQKHLFRHVRGILSPVEWTPGGLLLPTPAPAADREALLGLVRRWEGSRSAALAEHWLDRQPEAFFVLREDDGAVAGMLALLDLTAADAAARDADPGTRAAWRHVQRHAPPRGPEAVLHLRFLADRQTYQRSSPTMNAAPILVTQHVLNAATPSWALLTFADPEAWDEYFAVADFPRAVEADFTVGRRRYGLFAHDFRRVPVDAWLELVTERALLRDFTLPSRQPDQDALVLAREEFDEAVRQALRDLRRPDLLARNPLLDARMVRAQAGGRAPEAADLEALLGDAIDALSAHPRDDKLFRALRRTYVVPAATQEAAAEALGVPFGSFRRHLAQGVARVTGWLWDREVYGTAP